MKAWDYVINTAMLGTDKPMPGNPDLPDGVSEIVQMVDAIELLDKESKFLQKASVIYNYRQCGFKPFQQKDLPATIAPEETTPYCIEAAANVLIDILHEDNTSLLELWMSHCSMSGRLMLPEVLPIVLDKAEKDASLKSLAIACSGNRGLWLSQLNPAWDYFNSLPDEEIWKNGKPAERIELLKKIRQRKPEQAREWIQQTWEWETAANKVELLRTLRVNRTPADLPWLESLLIEKGQKVKDEALALLKMIPGSSIVDQYEELLKQSVILKKEKALLGMMNKVSIQQKLPATVDEGIFKSGIEKLAGQKSSTSDEGFIIYQLIAAVPPSFWEKQFDASPGEVVSYFEKHALSQMGALVKAVTNFNADNWIPYLLNYPELHVDFINKLPVQQRDNYILRFFTNDAQNTMNAALTCREEWSMELTKAIMGYMADRPYEYNRVFFSKNIKLIPAGIMRQLERFEPKDPRLQNTWEKSRDHLTKLLSLKYQTLKAFNA
ncbi:hypothetical protein G7092_21160 [Mucilaginibacter sp. HC2]|uniref:DUF5691 domain-containing protein n=1 Tax=Mucilaginibacter inviolabilis TaxID=2714892 RepID=UPI001408FA85|nr:DUF5691 domain-containing protein [Mucilaginibacter inviolabilis]NHA06332.1 hypothetical protein [Mucilaginibacter inviolabilis]